MVLPVLRHQNPQEYRESHGPVEDAAPLSPRRVDSRAGAVQYVVYEADAALHPRLPPPVSDAHHHRAGEFVIDVAEVGSGAAPEEGQAGAHRVAAPVEAGAQGQRVHYRVFDPVAARRQQYPRPVRERPDLRIALLLAVGRLALIVYPLVEQQVGRRVEQRYPPVDVRVFAVVCEAQAHVLRDALRVSRRLPPDHPVAHVFPQNPHVHRRLFEARHRPDVRAEAVGRGVVEVAPPRRDRRARVDFRVFRVEAVPVGHARPHVGRRESPYVAVVERADVYAARVFYAGDEQVGHGGPYPPARADFARVVEYGRAEHVAVV